MLPIKVRAVIIQISIVCYSNWVFSEYDESPTFPSNGVSSKLPQIIDLWLFVFVLFSRISFHITISQNQMVILSIQEEEDWINTESRALSSSHIQQCSIKVNPNYSDFLSIILILLWRENENYVWLSVVCTFEHYRKPLYYLSILILKFSIPSILCAWHHLKSETTHLINCFYPNYQESLSYRNSLCCVN